MEIGLELRAIRKSQRHTLSKVSEETGLSVSFLSDLERGRTRPSLDTLEKLAVFYQVPLNSILVNAETSSSPVARSYPAGFEDFLESVPGGVDEEFQELLLRVETRSKRRAETQEEWLQLYYSLKSILGR